MLKDYFFSVLLFTQLTQGHFNDLFTPIPSPSPFIGEWEIHSFMQDAGLHNHHILDADFDDLDQMWVATNDGLYKYDGYEWRTFTVQDGLPSGFIRCVLWSDLGLWVGTTEGVGIFDSDAKAFDTFGLDKHLPNPLVRRIVQDPDGTLWFCCDRWPNANSQGGLVSYKNGTWTTYTTADGLPSNYVQNYFQSSDGRQFALTKEGAAEKRGDKWVGLLPHIKKEFWNAAELNGTLFFSSNNSIYILSNGTWNEIKPSSLRQKYVLCKTRGNKIVTSVLISANQRQIMAWNGSEFEAVSPTFPHSTRYIEQLAESHNQMKWFIGPDILSCWQPHQNEWTVYNSIPAPKGYDKDNRVWFSDQRGSYVNEGDKWYYSPVHYTSIKQDRERNIWVLSEDSITFWEQDHYTRYSTADLELEQIIHFFIDRQNQLWIVGKKTVDVTVVLTKSNQQWKTLSHPLLQEYPFISGAPDENGVFLILKRGEFDFVVLNAAQTRIVNAGIPPEHQTVSYDLELYIRDNILWYFGTTGLHRFDRNKQQWKEYEIGKNHRVKKAMETHNAMWFHKVDLVGKKGSVFKIQDDDIVEYPHMKVFSIDNTIQNELLYGGVGKIHLFSEKTNWEPHHIHIPVQDYVDHIKGTHKNIWLSVNNLTMHYTPQPLSSKVYIAGYKKQIQHDEISQFHFQTRRKYIPFDDVHDFQYSWSLDGKKWTDFQYKEELTLNASDLKIGESQLFVRSRLSNFQITSQPAVYSFTVLPVPLQDTVWFPSAVFFIILLLSSLSFFAFLSRRRMLYLANTLESEVSKRTNELTQSKHYLQILSQKLFKIREEEQAKISRELHDDTSQMLTSLQLRLQNVQLQQPTKQLYKEMDDCLEHVQDIMQNIHDLSLGLRPSLLDELGLMAAVRWYAEHYAKQRGTNVSIHSSPKELTVNDNVKISCFRIVQEAVNNVVRHANAMNIRIALILRSDFLSLSVFDDGEGFDVQSYFQSDISSKGIGIIGMKERVEMLNGRFEIESKEKQGTIITAKIPLNC